MGRARFKLFLTMLDIKIIQVPTNSVTVTEKCKKYTEKFEEKERKSRLT